MTATEPKSFSPKRVLLGRYVQHQDDASGTEATRLLKNKHAAVFPSA